jgi:hypothetical protein
MRSIARPIGRALTPTLAPALAVLLLASFACRPVQRADPGFVPRVERPVHAAGSGPRVLIDQAHGNFHRNPGRYQPFAELLEADGYRIGALTTPFTADSLAAADLLVIANALAERNLEDWSLPTPSAFSPEEVAAVRQWVDGGGALLLIADHMPFPGAAGDLAAAFGVEWRNGFAFPAGPGSGGGLDFTRAGGGLRPHPITDGTDPGERVDSVRSFTGSAFRAAPGSPAADALQPLLVLPPATESFEPATAWEFDDATPRVPVGGWSQGAVLEIGSGRAAFFGEAAMFSAQLAGPNKVPVGMNAPGAEGNARLLRNLVRWLTAGTPDPATATSTAP